MFYQPINLYGFGLFKATTRWSRSPPVRPAGASVVLEVLKLEGLFEFVTDFSLLVGSCKTGKIYCCVFWISFGTW